MNALVTFQINFTGKCCCTQFATKRSLFRMRSHVIRQLFTCYESFRTHFTSMYLCSWMFYASSVFPVLEKIFKMQITIVAVGYWGSFCSFSFYGRCSHRFLFAFLFWNDAIFGDFNFYWWISFFRLYYNRIRATL